MISLLQRLDDIIDVDITEIEQCAKELDRHYIPSRYPDAYPKTVLQEYCTEVEKRFNPICIILYGSRAKGTFTNKSDVDIIVISNNFENDFLSRIRDLIDANTSSLPIEPLGYTESEFETMLGSCRITALDAVREGIPLSGEDYFNKLKNKLNALENIGLYKGRTSWHIPAAAIG